MALIIIVLGVIFGGIMTATEAASLGVALSVILALGYRKMSYKILKASFLDATKVTAMVMIIVAMDLAKANQPNRILTKTSKLPINT